MERSEIRGPVSCGSKVPDFAALHPGYETARRDLLEPQGVGVIIKASHHCMTTRGVQRSEDMADQQAPPAGPDLSKGIAPSEFAGDTLLGHVGDDEVVPQGAGARRAAR